MTNVVSNQAEIVARCAEVGLSIRGIERRAGLLLLRPASLEGLPSADTLRELAAALRVDGVRWVALDLEDEP